METSVAPIRVLVVEDHEIVRFAYEQLVQRMPETELVGYATDGQSAVELSILLKPHLVLMDIGLPVLDGIEATRLIKVQSPDTKILVVTAYDSDDFVFGAFAAGADGYCTKTIGFADLALAMKSVAIGACWMDPLIARRVLTAAQPDPAFMAPQMNGIGRTTSFGLTERELQILSLITLGNTNQEIANQLYVSPETVKTHVRNVMHKLSVSDRTQAAIKAIRHGIGC